MSRATGAASAADSRRSVWLMYHDVYRSAPVEGVSRGERLYHVSAERFATHLDAVQASGRQVLTAGECLANTGGSADAVVLTFDDGWQGTCEVAVSQLAERGLRATIYVTKNFVNRTGYASTAALRTAAEAGMEIGVHGVTHRLLSGCSWAEAVEEFRVCRDYLESVLGRAVHHASAPGGDTTPLIAASAREAGLQSLSTSRPGINSWRTPMFDLRRVAIKESTCADSVRRYCRFDVAREQGRWLLVHTFRSALGMERYARLRRAVLGGRRCIGVSA